MKKLRNLFLHVRVVGLSGIVILRVRPLFDRFLRRGRLTEQGRRFRFRLRGMRHALHYRPGASDLKVASQVFVHQEYACLRGLEGVRTILDCGANVGYTSAYLLESYPEARLIAIEPDGRNAELCRENLQPYGDRATVLEGAVWSRTAALKLLPGTYRDGAEWATQVRECGAGEAADVEAWGIADLMERFGLPQIDVLKLDIEGSEGRVISENSDGWLPRIRNMAVEIHDRENERLVTEAMERYPLHRSASGELAVFRTAAAG